MAPRAHVVKRVFFTWPYVIALKSKRTTRLTQVFSKANAKADFGGWGVVSLFTGSVGGHVFKMAPSFKKPIQKIDTNHDLFMLLYSDQAWFGVRHLNWTRPWKTRYTA